MLVIIKQSKYAKGDDSGVLKNKEVNYTVTTKIKCRMTKYTTNYIVNEQV